RMLPTHALPLMVMRGLEASGSKGHSIYCKWESFDNISDNAKVAVIAEEDQKFASHEGFDMEAIQKALKHNSKSKRIHGGSTISQQVAKNIFLWNSRSWIRKGFEVYFTFLIEHLWGKERILQMYLNVAEMGDGVFGVQSVSEIYFHKNADRLTPDQAALIAAVLPNPRLYKIQHPSAYVLRRQARILRAMKKIGGVNYLDNL
ncbi:MAG: monofunctional biosynthetic peptidoglycan transglycosylase, partial [Bacteroidia bacterium]